MVSDRALTGNSVDTDADISNYLGQPNGDEFKPEEPRFLLDRMIGFGNITALEGLMKGGKSTVLGGVVGDVVGGLRLPGASKRRVLGPVLYYCREEQHDQGVKARVHALEGDPNLVLWPRGKGGLGIANVGFPGECERMEKVIKAEGVAGVIIDQLDSFVDARYNMAHGQPTRQVFDPLIEVASRTGVFIIAVRQWTKDEGAAAIFRGAGNVAWGAACRSVLAMSTLPGKKDWFVLSRIAGNFGATPPPLAFELKPVGSVGVPIWHPKYMVNQDELAGARFDAGQRDEGDDATKLLKAHLGDDWVPYEMLRFACPRFGCTERTLRRRKAELGCLSRRRTLDGKHFAEWHAPKGGWPK